MWMRINHKKPRKNLRSTVSLVCNAGGRGGTQVSLSLTVSIRGVQCEFWKIVVSRAILFTCV